MKIAWDKSRLAIAIKCKDEQEFDTMMRLLEEKTKTHFSVQIKDPE